MKASEITPLKQASGKQLTTIERTRVIKQLIDILTEGYASTNKLSKMTGLSRRTIDKYRVVVDEIIAERKIDRNVVRNLQLQRTYNMIERVVADIDEIDQDVNDILLKAKAKAPLYAVVAKFSQHLALITGLNIETQVNVDQKQLVIVRANKEKGQAVIDVPAAELIDKAIAYNDSVPIEKSNSQPGDSPTLFKLPETA